MPDKVAASQLVGITNIKGEVKTQKQLMSPQTKKQDILEIKKAVELVDKMKSERKSTRVRRQVSAKKHREMIQITIDKNNKEKQTFNEEEMKKREQQHEEVLKKIEDRKLKRTEDLRKTSVDVHKVSKNERMYLKMQQQNQKHEEE
jgi:hypothetical protein